MFMFVDKKSYIIYLRWLYFGEEDSYEPFVSKCKTNGRRHTRVIISGLIAPTSLVAVQDRLYVGEMTGGIVMFNLEGTTKCFVLPLSFLV